LNPVNRRKI